MAIQTAETLKGYFSAGKFPTQSNYEDLIDSIVGMQGGGGNTVVTIHCGCDGDFRADSFIGSPYNVYTTQSGGINNPSAPVALDDLIDKFNSVSSETVDWNTKVLIIANQEWFYGAGPYDKPMVVGYGYGIKNETVTISENDGVAVFVRGPYDNWELVKGYKASESGEIPRLVLDLYSPSIYATWSGSALFYNDWTAFKYQAIPIDELIQCFTEGSGQSNGGNEPNIPTDAKTIIVVNDGWGNAGSAGDVPPIYISCRNSEVCSVLENNQAMMFTKTSYNYWIPVQRGVTITTYELSQLQQDAMGNGS